MSKTVTISDELAARLEQLRADEGFESLDAAAETLISQGLYVGDDDVMDERTIQELRALIAEADASGPAVDWDAKAVRAEVLRRYAERNRQP
ncbi:MAG: hypothetical protein H7124_06310 [Phycisphaerales bacterium]|nr:hypothetical protein [Hyphomonadaceae bacterium]